MRNGHGRIELLAGLLLLTAALGLTGANLWRDRQAGAASRAALSQLEAQRPAPGEGAGAPRGEMPVQEAGGRFYLGVLTIPALELRLPVLSEYVLEHLQTAPCRFAGSAYTDDLVLCAHNYRSHFGRLASLSAGDPLTLTDRAGNVFSYAVREILVLEPYETEEFTESGYALTLFTCTVSGQARVVVRCDRQPDGP